MGAGNAPKTVLDAVTRYRYSDRWPAITGTAIDHGHGVGGEHGTCRHVSTDHVRPWRPAGHVAINGTAITDVSRAASGPNETALDPDDDSSDPQREGLRRTRRRPSPTGDGKQADPTGPLLLLLLLMLLLLSLLRWPQVVPTRHFWTQTMSRAILPKVARHALLLVLVVVVLLVLLLLLLLPVLRPRAHLMAVKRL